jgi:hypothetical protein
MAFCSRIGFLCCVCFQHACKRCISSRTTASHDFAPFCLQGYGVYRFEDKYGANVDGYSPIYTPDQWTESGDSYKLGTKGLIAWWVAQTSCAVHPDFTRCVMQAFARYAPCQLHVHVFLHP